MPAFKIDNKEKKRCFAYIANLIIDIEKGRMIVDKKEIKMFVKA